MLKCLELIQSKQTLIIEMYYTKLSMYIFQSLSETQVFNWRVQMHELFPVVL